MLEFDTNVPNAFDIRQELAKKVKEIIDLVGMTKTNGQDALSLVNENIKRFDTICLNEKLDNLIRNLRNPRNDLVKNIYEDLYIQLVRDVVNYETKLKNLVILDSYINNVNLVYIKALKVAIEASNASDKLKEETILNINDTFKYNQRFSDKLIKLYKDKGFDINTYKGYRDATLYANKEHIKLNKDFLEKKKSFEAYLEVKNRLYKDDKVRKLNFLYIKWKNDLAYISVCSDVFNEFSEKNILKIKNFVKNMEDGKIEKSIEFIDRFNIYFESKLKLNEFERINRPVLDTNYYQKLNGLIIATLSRAKLFANVLPRNKTFYDIVCDKNRDTNKFKEYLWYVIRDTNNLDKKLVCAAYQRLYDKYSKRSKFSKIFHASERISLKVAKHIINAHLIKSNMVNLDEQIYIEAHSETEEYKEYISNIERISNEPKEDLFNKLDNCVKELDNEKKKLTKELNLSSNKYMIK